MRMIDLIKLLLSCLVFSLLLTAVSCTGSDTDSADTSPDTVQTGNYTNTSAESHTDNTVTESTDTEGTDITVITNTAEPTDTTVAGTAVTDTDTEDTAPETTEAETEHVISKPENAGIPGSNYISVKDYGAVGDGVTDDYEAISAALAAAYKVSGDVYFPEGRYLVTKTLKLEKKDSVVMNIIGNDAVLIGDSSLDGAILKNGMKYNFCISGLDFIHNGKGSCIDALFLRTKYCTFKSNADNTSDLVVFGGSDCRIASCTFYTENASAYALSYIKQLDEISINDYIIDNVFHGTGMGIRVGDGEHKEDGRCEGLKINGNYFYNTGAEQIRVTEILHIDIAHNIMRGCTGDTIVLTQLGHGADGIYINNNSIVNAGHSCIVSVTGGENYISMVNINNNLLCGGEYGVDDEVLFSKAYVRSNTFKGQSTCAYFLAKKRVPSVYFMFDNIFDEAEGVYSLYSNIRGTIIFRDNYENCAYSISYPNLRADYENSLTTSYPTNKTAHPEWTDDQPDNKYEGEPDIPVIEGEDEPEEMKVNIISDDPIEVELYASDETDSILKREAYSLNTNVALHFVATAKFTSVSAVCPSWGDNIGTMKGVFYKWDGNYEKTLKSTPIAETVWESFNDNAVNKITFDEQPAGEYLIVLSVDPDKVGDNVGIWAQKVAHPNSCLYKNGVICDGWEIEHFVIYYTQTPDILTWKVSNEK